MKKYILSTLCLSLCCLLALCGCSESESSADNQSVTSTASRADTEGMDFTFNNEDISAPDQTESATDVTVSESQSVSDTDAYTITSGGIYTFTGEHKDIMLLIDAEDADVTIILDGTSITNSKGPAVYVRAADKLIISLADGTKNTLSDGSSYNITDNDSTLDGAIFSKADLVINGNGTLDVIGNYKHGIVSKDDLIISSGTLNVTAQNVALNGKDCVKINSGNLTLNAGSDGIRSDNTEDASKGYVYLSGGTLCITSDNDGIQAETVVNIENATLNITAGGGSGTSLSSSSESYKGIKAGSDIYITGGSFDINSKDDCIHSNNTIIISGGTYTLSSGDDGVHADTDLEISGDSTKLTIKKSYEGIEATNLILKGGSISVKASDDGLNAAGGNNTVSSGGFGRPGHNHFSGSTGSILISGGDIYINMSGDGIDANGTLSITGGNITVSGANRGDTAILDFDSAGTISGGVFLSTGASGMAQNFSTSSTQGVIFTTCSTQSEDTDITLKDSNGKTVVSYKSDQEFSCVIISHPDIKEGEIYTLTIGSLSAEITMTDTVYGFGSGRGGHGGGPGKPGGWR